MKTIYVAFSVAVCSILCSCNATKDIQVPIQKTAVTELPKNIARIVLVNCSLSNGASIDTTLSEQSISGITEIFKGNKNITIIHYNKILKTDRLNNTDPGTPISWQLIEDIAGTYNADAIITATSFGSSFTTHNLTKKNNTAVAIAGASASVNTGFRIYMPATRTIFDEKVLKSIKAYNEIAEDYTLAGAKLITATDGLNAVSYQAGAQFAKRLIPYTILQDRIMYTGITLKMIEGQKAAAASKWQQSIHAWLAAYEHTKNTTTRGKIAYNIALGYEALDKLQEAKLWIMKSCAAGSNKKAQEYAAIINKRIKEDNTYGLQVSR
jgi:hypothetical protein